MHKYGFELAHELGKYVLTPPMIEHTKEWTLGERVVTPPLKDLVSQMHPNQVLIQFDEAGKVGMVYQTIGSMETTIKRLEKASMTLRQKWRRT